jgi:hypothetical protein
MAATDGAEEYWVADDDIIPRPEFSLSLASDLAAAKPNLGLIGAWLPVCGLPHLFRPTDHSDPREARDQVEEFGRGVGGLRLMRGSAMAAVDAAGWPDFDPGIPGYDVPLARALRAVGRPTGYFTDRAPRSLRCTHLGECVSELWPHLDRGAEFPWDYDA